MKSPDYQGLAPLIEDEIKIADFVIAGLEAEGFQVRHCSDGESGLDALQHGKFDIVLLDVMLPKLDGFSLLKKVRATGNDTPVIILSAKTELPDRLLGFDIGSDDYLPKPFYVEELIARMKALLHRKAVKPVNIVSYKNLQLDVVDRKAQWFEATAILSQREFSLLSYLMRMPGHIYSRQQILKHVWGIEFDPETNIVDVCVRRIKRKLVRQNLSEDSPIQAVRGVGYRLNTEAMH